MTSSVWFACITSAFISETQVSLRHIQELFWCVVVIVEVIFVSYYTLEATRVEATIMVFFSCNRVAVTWSKRLGVYWVNLIEKTRWQTLEILQTHQTLWSNIANHSKKFLLSSLRKANCHHHSIPNMHNYHMPLMTLWWSLPRNKCCNCYISYISSRSGYIPSNYYVHQFWLILDVSDCFYLIQHSDIFTFTVFCASLNNHFINTSKFIIKVIIENRTV